MQTNINEKLTIAGIATGITLLSASVGFVQRISDAGGIAVGIAAPIVSFGGILLAMYIYENVSKPSA